MDGDVEVRYALSGDARLAFTVRGDGPHEIVEVAGWVSNQDADDRSHHRFVERLTAYATVVSYDPRGTGLSDPFSFDAPPTLEHRSDDLHAVITASGVGPAVLFAPFASGLVAALYATTHPERTRALILLNSYAMLAWSEGYEIGVRPEVHERWVALAERWWGTGHVLGALMPDTAIDEARRNELARLERQTASPNVATAINRQIYTMDVRAILPSISAPTLVLHTRNPFVPIKLGRYLAEHIPRSRFVELPGTDLFVINDGAAQAPLTEEIEEFVTGVRAAAEPDRILTTLLFTDVIGSTDHVAAIGDRAWRNLLDRHDDAVRRQLERFSGRDHKFTGDGILATFPGPARAIRCGAAIRDVARQLGLDVRVGIHTGEVERRGPELAGIAVHLAHRVCESAEPGAVYVTGTVVDLVAGSGMTFQDRGERELKGIPTRWRLLSLTD